MEINKDSSHPIRCSRTDQHVFQGDAACDCRRRYKVLWVLTCLSVSRPSPFVVWYFDKKQAWLYLSTDLQSVWASGVYLARLLLGLLDKTQSESRKRERKISDKCLERKQAQQQPPWRPREEPKLPSPPLWAKPLLNPPRPKSSVPLPTALDRHTWLTLARAHTHTHTHKWKSSLERPVFSLCLSADHFGLLSPQILCRPSLSGSARFSFFIFRPPIIPSVMRSPPLKRPVSLSVLKGESSLWQRLFSKRADDPTRPSEFRYIAGSHFTQWYKFNCTMAVQFKTVKKLQ